jgi:hypothetical protein
LVRLLKEVGDELGIGIPLTALAVSIGCDIGQDLRSEDDIVSSNPPPPIIRVLLGDVERQI